MLGLVLLLVLVRMEGVGAEGLGAPGLGAQGLGAQGMGPDEAALDDAIRLGTVATLAPLCALRDEAWAFDLRRATILEATRTDRPDDDALRAAPGRELAVGALSHAEAEALESFAEAPAAATCGPLARDPQLARADAVVEAFRLRKGNAKPGS